MTPTDPAAESTFDFREPFVGHLPGYLAASEMTAPGPPLPEVYERFLMRRWRALLDSPASREEKLVHQFLERHPSLLPGPIIAPPPLATLGRARKTPTGRWPRLSVPARCRPLTITTAIAHQTSRIRSTWSVTLITFSCGQRC